MNIPSPLERHPRFRRLADYLTSKAPPGKLPGRQHVDPAEIVDLLPHLMLVDIVPQEDGSARYRIRLMGTEVIVAQGSDDTGKFVDEVLTEAGCADIVRGYDGIRRTKQPQYRGGMPPVEGREHIYYERVAFPLAGDGENVDVLILIFGESKNPKSKPGSG